MMMIFIAAALLALALVAGMVALRNGRLWRAARSVEVTTPEAVLEEADAARAAGSPLTRLCAVQGTAGAGNGGMLVSAVNSEPCVWHRHAVVHRQVQQRTDSKGRLRRSTRRKRIGGSTSLDPFRLDGAHRQVDIQHAGMRIDRPAKGRTRILPAMVSQPFPHEGALMSTTQNFFKHKEWVLREGTQLYVLGELSGARRTVIRKPANGPHIISTRTPSQVLNRARLTCLGAVLVALLAAAGAIAAVP